MLTAMMSYVWPKDDAMIRKRVVLSLSLLIASKVATVGVPFIFKAAVDGLNVLSMATAPEAVLASTVSLVIGYGIARSGAAAFNEIRNAVFAKVAHHSIRKIATNVFMHLHNLDLAFHLNRQTGALSKVRCAKRRTNRSCGADSEAVNSPFCNRHEASITYVFSSKLTGNHDLLCRNTKTHFRLTDDRSRIQRNQFRADCHGLQCRSDHFRVGPRLKHSRRQGTVDQTFKSLKPHQHITFLAVRLSLRRRFNGLCRCVCSVHSDCDPMAYEIPCLYESRGKRCRQQGHRLAHQLRNGKIFQQRKIRGAALRQRAEELRASELKNGIKSGAVELGTECHFQRRSQYDHGAGGTGNCQGQHDRRRLSDGEWIAVPIVNSVGFPWKCVPRSATGSAGYEKYVCAHEHRVECAEQN